MLTIRLQRIGKKNKVHFRLVLAEKTSHASKKFVEVLGSYNPHSKDFQLKNQERLQYWVAQHVSISPTAHNLLVSHKFLEASKVKAFTTPKKAAPKETVAAETAPKVEETAAPVESPTVENPENTEEAKQE